MDDGRIMTETMTETPAPETGEPTQTELPMGGGAEAKAEAVETQPEAVTPPEPPKPKPKSKPKAKAKPKDADPLEEMRAEVAAAKEARAGLESARDEFAAMVTREKDKRRLVFLRTMGAIENVPDDQLLQIAPPADVETIAGRAKLDEWRSSVPTLFSVQSTPTLTPESLVERAGVREGASFFTTAKATDFLRRNMSKG